MKVVFAIFWCRNKIIIFIFLSFKNVDKKSKVKPIARRLQKLEPNEIFAEVVSYIIKLSKKTLSWRTKICLYKSLILAALLYGAETWTLKSSDEQALGDLSAIEENGAYDGTSSCTIYMMTST